VVRTIKAAGDFLGDLHEFTITDAGTALLTIYGEPEQADLSAFGRTEPGWIIDSLFQEIDLETGQLIFQWKAGDHYTISETLAPIGSFGRSKDNAFEYFHINSISKDDVGNYYISSRYMQTITCISPSGTILWKLGGRNNSFTDLSSGAATNFSWQHHMRWHPGNRITLFDNGAFNWLSTANHSRGLHIQLDTGNKTASLIQAFVKPGVLAHSQGSVQLMPDTGNVFVGWGHSSAYTEFAADGAILCDVHYGPSAFFGLGWAKSYRAFKAPWAGRPRTVPDVAMKDGAVYVSWNGATEVAAWGLEVSDGGWNGTFVEVRQVIKDGFETKLALPEHGLRHSRDRKMPLQRHYRIAALDNHGQRLAASKTIDVVTGYVVDDMQSEEPVLDNTSLLTAAIAAVCLFCTFYVVVSKAKDVARVWGRKDGNMRCDDDQSQAKAMLAKNGQKRP